jgi:hypothetical protein
MLEEIAGEPHQRRGKPSAGLAFLTREGVGGRRDLVEKRRDGLVVGLEPVDVGVKMRSAASDGRKQTDVFTDMVRVNQLAVAEAVDTQLEQRATGLQLSHAIA